MAYVYKSDARPAAPVLSYAQLAKMQRKADKGSAAAAIRLAQLPEPEQRLARGLVTAFAGKAEGGTLPGRSGKKARAELKAKRAAQPRRPTLRDMLRADLCDPDPRIRLTAERALKAL